MFWICYGLLISLCIRFLFFIDKVVNMAFFEVILRHLFRCALGIVSPSNKGKTVKVAQLFYSVVFGGHFTRNHFHTGVTSTIFFSSLLFFSLNVITVRLPQFNRVDDQIAQLSVEFRHKYHLSMGDSMIAATASILHAVCITDPHFKQISEIQTEWL
jgi:hypothetical protein